MPFTAAEIAHIRMNLEAVGFSTTTVHAGLVEVLLENSALRRRAAELRETTADACEQSREARARRRLARWPA
jgi:hypothetical protein